MAVHEDIELTGMVIQAVTSGEYNRRLVIVTGESGRITAFARGARKPGSRFMGDTEPMSFGKFRVIRGRDAYTLTDVNITRHFEELRGDFDDMVMASYFMEIADFYTKENLEAYEELNLIYASFLALISHKFDRRLVRSVYELKSLVTAGEYPGVPGDRVYMPSTVYAMEYVRDCQIKDLYKFNVTGNVVSELDHVGRYLMNAVTGHDFKSLQLL